MYDVLIVGARCAGAATALSLARRGARVLLVDRARFPSDTVSTHLLHAAGVAHLRNLGLLKPLLSGGCPPIATIRFQPEADLVLQGTPYPYDGVSISLAPRRTVLDALLVEAAAAAGAEVRERVSFQKLIWHEDRVVGAELVSNGRRVAERAALVVGADGRHSSVARSAGAAVLRDGGSFGCQFYGYWGGLPDEGARVFVGGGQAVLAYPTHGGEHLVLVGWPRARFAEARTDIDRYFLAAVAAKAPSLREYLTDEARTGRINGSADLSNFVRASSGPGWVLVGDAAVAKDAVTAQGIGDALSQARSIADRLPAALADGPAAVDAATAAHTLDRDRDGAAAFATTLAFATGGNAEAMSALFRAIQGRPELICMFFGVYAGRVTLEELIAATGPVSSDWSRSEPAAGGT